MKQFFFIFSLLLASASAGTTFDDELREFFEYIKQQMPCGFPSLGIPPLAPYTVDFRAFDLNNIGVDLSGNITNLSVNGLNDIEIRELTFSTTVMRLRYDINFNKIQILSQYNANGGLKLLGLPIPMAGSGDIDLVLENLRFNGSFRLRPTTTNGLQIWAFDTSVQLEGVQSQTTGIMNNPFYTNIFNQWIEEFLTILFDDNQVEISNAIRNHVVPGANALLKNVSMIELVALFLGFGPNSDNLPVCQL